MDYRYISKLAKTDEIAFHGIQRHDHLSFAHSSIRVCVLIPPTTASKCGMRVIDGDRVIVGETVPSGDGDRELLAISSSSSSSLEELGRMVASYNGLAMSMGSSSSPWRFAEGSSDWLLSLRKGIGRGLDNSMDSCSRPGLFTVCTLPAAVSTIAIRHFLRAAQASSASRRNL